MRSGSFILVLIILVSFMNFVSGYQLGIGPPEIEIGYGGCGEIYVFSEDYAGKIEIVDKWSKERSVNLGDYNLNAEDIGLDVRYFKNFQLNGIGKTKICIYGDRKYYGLILFRAVDGNLEVGTRVIFNGENGIIGIGKNFISGMTVKEDLKFFEGFGAKEAVLASSFAVSLTLLWFLFFILRKKNKKEVLGEAKGLPQNNLVKFK